MDEQAGQTTQIHNWVVTGVVTCGFTSTRTLKHLYKYTQSDPPTQYVSYV